MNINRISFCTVIMNRLEHLKETLLQNLNDNNNYKNFEFLLLDYNSTDGLDIWVKENLMGYINEGTLNYYRTEEPKSFHRSHSRNVALRLASGNILCNVDADNLLGKDFSNYINYQFSFNEDIFMTSGSRDGSYGRICVKKDDFIHLRGYDEKMSGWGYEDDDLYSRLEKFGKTRIEFRNEEFTKFIDHEIEDSFSNDKSILNLKKIYVQYVSYNKSNILFLFKDNSFNYGAVYKPSEYSDVELENYWEKGLFEILGNRIIFNFESSKKMVLTSTNENFLHQKGFKDFLQTDKELSNYLKILYTSLENKKLYKKEEKKVISNNKDWGKVIVTKNFSEKVVL